jgi:hypothetical protein
MAAERARRLGTQDGGVKKKEAKKDKKSKKRKHKSKDKKKVCLLGVTRQVSRMFAK